VPETLTPKRCRECGKPVMVAEYSPHPLEREATGMSATRWDADLGREYFVGWICEGCAFARVGPGLPHSISGGGGGMEFHYGIGR
jgi:hypothetical protein